MFDYKSKKWVSTAKKIMMRDGYLCRLSRRYGKIRAAEVVHHIYPADEFPEFAYEPWNLISLSRYEHNKLHDRNTGKLTTYGMLLQRRTKPK